MNRLWSWEQAITKSDLAPFTRLLLFTLATYMDKHGKSCFPSIPEISKASGMGERSVSTHIETARKEGWLIVSKRKNAGQKWEHNFYEANWPEPKIPDLFEGGAGDAGVQETAKGGAGDAGYQSSYQSNDKYIGERFDLLWQDITPRLPRDRRRDKAKAKKKFISLAKKKGLDVDTLDQAIRCYYHDQGFNDACAYASGIYRCLTGEKYAGYIGATIEQISAEKQSSQQGGRNGKRSFNKSGAGNTRASDASQRRADDQERRREAARKLDEQLAGS